VSTTGPHEFTPSPWMRKAISERFLQIASGSAPIDAPLGIIMFNLTDVDGADEREDRTCDRCRSYTPPGTLFYTGLHDQDPARLPWPWSETLADHQILVAFGLCEACARLEDAELD